MSYCRSRAFSSTNVKARPEEAPRSKQCSFCREPSESKEVLRQTIVVDHDVHFQVPQCAAGTESSLKWLSPGAWVALDAGLTIADPRRPSGAAEVVLRRHA
jgi:hypothetical protein